MAVLDAVHDLKVITKSITGPASYATGGFLVDASADLTFLGFMVITVVAGALPGHEFEEAVDVDLTGAEAFGKGVVKVVKHTVVQASVGNVSGQPGGVTVQAALAANAVSTHTHPLDHDHGAVTSGTEAQATPGSIVAATPDHLGHTHNFTIPALVLTSAAGGSHGHNRAFEYEHNHPTTVSTTDITATEVTAGTNLSGVTFEIVCLGFGPG